MGTVRAIHLSDDDDTADANPSSEASATEAQTFILSTVTASAGLFDIDFNLALHGEVFYDKYLMVWVLATAVILASLVVQRGHKPVGFGGGVVLLLPGLYFFVGLLLNQSLRLLAAGSELERVDALAGALVAIVSLVPMLMAAGLSLVFLFVIPYVVYLLARILNPELVTFRSWRYRLGFVGIAGFFAVSSLIAGLAHPLYLTCESFAAAGAKEPDNCTRMADFDKALESP